MRRRFLIIIALIVSLLTASSAHANLFGKLTIRQGPRCDVAVSVIELPEGNHVIENKVLLQFRKNRRWHTYAASSSHRPGTKIRLMSCRTGLRRYKRRAIARQGHTDPSGTATINNFPRRQFR